MIELFGEPTSETLSAAIALEEAGLGYVQRIVGADGKGLRSIRLFNPVGSFPVLMDRTGPHQQPTIVTQSSAIMVYVAEKSGVLLPRTTLERMRAIEWLFVLQDEVNGPIRQASFLRAAGSPSYLEAASLLESRALSAYPHLDRRLEEHTFLAGETFTVADIAAFAVIASMSWPTSGEYPNARRWYRMVGDRPAVRRGMATFR